MSTEENKALVRRAFELGDQRNWAAFYELTSSDFVFHNASMTIRGLEAYKQSLSMYFTAFPDLHSTIEDMIAEGDTVVVRYTWRGTHQGGLMGIPPTGKQVAVSAIAIFRIANGKGIEEWLNADYLGLLQQLGVIPALGLAS
jgi:steroid delta-isomerase-like uncharacterized protein